MVKMMIKLVPTIIFIICFIVIQFLPTNYAFMFFGLIVPGYTYGISVFLEKYRKNGELNNAISVNFFLLVIVIFSFMITFTLRALLEVIL